MVIGTVAAEVGAVTYGETKPLRENDIGAGEKSGENKKIGAMLGVHDFHS